MALIGALRETGLTQPQTPKEIGNAQRDMDDDDEGDDEQIEEESPQKNCTEPDLPLVRLCNAAAAPPTQHNSYPDLVKKP